MATMETRKIDIVKVGERWWVIRDSPEKFPRGQLVEWTLHPPGLSAHFQFPDVDLILKDPTGLNRLTADLTATIAKAGDGLTLQVRDDADRRKNPRRYAVWVVEDKQEFGGTYAVGETGNPPPEFEIGP